VCGLETNVIFKGGRGGVIEPVGAVVDTLEGLERGLFNKPHEQREADLEISDKESIPTQTGASIRTRARRAERLRNKCRSDQTQACGTKTALLPPLVMLSAIAEFEDAAPLLTPQTADDVDSVNGI
jgi:hypothetical protein